MNTQNAAILETDVVEETNDKTFRRSVVADTVGVFAEIYDDNTNITVWKRSFSEQFYKDMDTFLAENSGLQMSMVVTANNVYESVKSELGNCNAVKKIAVEKIDEGKTVAEQIAEQITELVDMFCCLFELKSVGLRLRALDKAMCPKFHVDKVPCRLVTTFSGVATEWLPHNVIDRSKLGAASLGLQDDQSGLFQSHDDIQQLQCGDVALLKGERWEGNQGAGLVHRSPQVQEGHRRLLLTLDFIDG